MRQLLSASSRATTTNSKLVPGRAAFVGGARLPAACRQRHATRSLSTTASTRPVVYQPNVATPIATSSSKLATLSGQTPQLPEVEDADIVIVGGGVVGLALACGLTSPASSSSSSSPSSPSITLIEASSLDRVRNWARDRTAARQSQDGQADGVDWENRVVSLTSENMQWLRDLGVYDYLVQERLRPIEAMRVWDGLSGALIDFDSADLRDASLPSTSRPQISVMVEISNLQQAMLRFLEDQGASSQVRIRDDTKVQRIVAGAKSLACDAPELDVQDRDPWPVLDIGSASQPLRARLLVGADGPNSPVRKYSGIDHYGWPYNRKGLVGTLRCAGPESGEPPVGHVAYQRFLPSGTVAFLPLSDQTGSMVWALEPQVAQALTIMHRETAGSSTEPLARLIDGAFRLPWAELERLFQQIVSYSQTPVSDAQPRDWSWVIPSIPTELDFVASSSGPLPESASGDVPPKVRSIDLKSVASFPLQLKHADAYLGSSLNGGLPRPSGILGGALAIAGFAAEGAGQGGGRSRTALVGDAAHTIHPLAGQGLNLGIADVRSLSAVLRDAQRAGADLGSHNALKDYPRQRYWENQKMLSAVDHLHWLFAGVPVPLAAQADGGRAQFARDGLVKGVAKEAVARGVVWARSTGLEVLNELGVAKNAFMRQAGSTTGAARRRPTGVRGIATFGQVRYHSSKPAGTPLASDAYTRTDASPAGEAVRGTPSLSSLTPAQRRALSDMLRVDHSGEVAANTIYEGQADVFGALGDVKNRDMSREMWSTERKHLDVMRVLLRQHNVRPSALLPVWGLAGRILGGVTAFLGPRSAMACTEAVESVIGEHYDDQLAALESIVKEEGVHPSLPLLAKIIREFRDDELEHLDTAVEHESQQAAAHALLSTIIATGCKAAIKIAAKV